MDIDPPYMQGMQEHNEGNNQQQRYQNNSTSHVYHSESSMNFDYLQGLRAGAAGASASSSNTANQSYGLVDDSRAQDSFVSILDQLDARVEKFRKDALNLLEKKDYLLMSMDLIKSNEILQTMSDGEREEIILYIQRVNTRLATVDLSVRTVRDSSQEDSLSQINALIDTMIKMGDPVIARQRCQLYLNACCSTSMDPGNYLDTVLESDVGPIDKKFESTLLGCTLDDQKNIKKRLQALMGYLNKQTVTN